MITLLPATTVADVTFAPGPGPLDNPLKGYAAYSGPTFKHTAPVSMAYTYAFWSDLEPKEGQYVFKDWEQENWETPLAKGKHLVFRLTLDYPNRPPALPKWLIDKGVKMTPYDQHGGGLSPDYESPILQRHLLKLIDAAGKRYNSNPRVAFVQLGILGHWGEWHTYPVDSLFASPKTQRWVVDAMHRAFPNKHIMARNAAYESVRLPWIGFHDDMIPEDTLGPEPWSFRSALRTGGRLDNWKVAPTGGEMVPGAAKRYLGEDWPTLVKAVEEMHFSWIGPYAPAIETPPDAIFNQRMHDLIRKLGYEYRLTRLRAPQSLRAGSRLSLRLEGVNQGVAPFYYPWKVRFALLDKSGKPVQAWTANTDIRKWLPGPFALRSAAKVAVPPGTYRLAIGILDPYKGKPNIAFANRLERVGGYTVLAPIKVAR
ncbi:MAG TPA: DUF4832 domain-containing protein [Fimbriimonas sp.]